jgi:hypothetical protein
VRITEEFESCNCPDFELRGHRCKHLYCVESVIQRELQFETQTETVTIVKRRTYRQNWPVYNESQVKEKEVFQKLLADLCSRIDEPEQTNGRPRLPLRDVVFACIFKVYSTFSGRRFMTDLREAHEQG